MSFEDRNAVWDGTNRREFFQVHSRSVSARVWVIQVVGNSIHTSWGQLGGQMQQAVEHMHGVNIGKSNEKSPEVYALERAREMCRKKNWEGYREVDPATTKFIDPPVVPNINFDDLPLSLCFYKPDNSMGAGITKKAEAGQVWYARKANGLMYVIAKGQYAHMYSRRMLRYQDDEAGQIGKTWDDRFTTIVEAADRIMPANSILLGELVVRDAAGRENFKLAQSLSKSLTDQARMDIELMGQDGWQPAFYCWDMAFWDGEDLVSKAPVRERYSLIHEIAEYPILPVEYFPEGYFATPLEAVGYAKEKDWEGFVVVDQEGIYGDKAYNFKGKPDRPGSFCAKLKPEYEDDFIAIWDPDHGYGERSTKGRYQGGIKCVGLYQYNCVGDLVFIANVSSGMTEEMKRDWARTELYPMVWKVTYTDRRYISQGDDTNAIDFPRFTEVRTDKKPEECINLTL